MSPVDEVELIQIHGDDLFLGIASFQPGGGQPFFELDAYHGKHPAQFAAAKIRPVKQQFGQLLGDRTSAALLSSSEKDTLAYHPAKGNKVYTARGIEAAILCRDQCLQQQGVELIIIYRFAVLYIILSQRPSVLGIDDTGEVDVRILELFK